MPLHVVLIKEDNLDFSALHTLNYHSSLNISLYLRDSLVSMVRVKDLNRLLFSFSLPDYKAKIHHVHLQQLHMLTRPSTFNNLQ